MRRRRSESFDGISYMKGSAILRQARHPTGRRGVPRGTVDHFGNHFFGNATMADLVASWERASGSDLTDFTEGWLMAAGVDLLSYDRPAGVLRRTPPVDHPSTAATPSGSSSVTATAGSPSVEIEDALIRGGAGRPPSWSTPTPTPGR
ncbi:MAG: M1 family aminopeptidase [Nocardioidaceae bacterium]